MHGWPSILAHLAADAAMGWALLSWRPAERTVPETLCLAMLLGIYAETLTAAVLFVLGVPLAATAAAVLGLGLVLVVTALRRRPFRWRIPRARPRWYEWLLVVAIAEKLFFVVWLLARTDLYFDDAMTIWAARARALVGGNWSLDPASPLFLAGHLRHDIVHYPWLLSLWRALTATMCGGWDDVVARADGLVFFAIVVAAVWLAVRRLSARRWLAAGAAFTVASMPLQAWHAASGYADIAVEAFATVGLAAALRGEWLWAGTMAAGAAWSKNDGLVLCVPTLLLGALVSRAGRGRAVLELAAGFATIAPWLLFKAYHRLGVAPNIPSAWHPEAFPLLAQAVLPNPTNGFLWISAFACVLITCRGLWRDPGGRTALAAFAAGCVALVGIFSMTEAYAFLANQGTIHRSLLQLSSIAIVTCAYGVDLALRDRAERQLLPPSE